MNLDGLDISRNGAKVALSCLIGLTVGIPVCILASIPIGLLSGIATLAFTSILLHDNLESEEV